MQVSKETIGALKNFATINQSLLFSEGRTQKTMAVAKNIFASVEMKDKFPVGFGIYDLTEFLNTLSMFDEPKFEFSDSFVTISDVSGANCKYNFAAASLIVSPPEDKTLEMPSVDISFTITEDNFGKIIKATSVLGLPDISLRNNGGSLMLGVIDKAASKSNAFEICVGSHSGEFEFDVHIRAELLKLLPGDYDVEISKIGFSRWEGHSNSAEYFIALEKTSTFGE